MYRPYKTASILKEVENDSGPSAVTVSSSEAQCALVYTPELVVVARYGEGAVCGSSCSPNTVICWPGAKVTDAVTCHAVSLSFPEDTNRVQFEPTALVVFCRSDSAARPSTNAPGCELIAKSEKQYW